MPNEKLEKLKHEQYVAERKLTAAKHKEKRLESEIMRLTRSERTHRLCTRAGMLETFLREPTIKIASPEISPISCRKFVIFAMMAAAQGAKCRVRKRAKVAWSGAVDPSRRYIKLISR